MKITRRGENLVFLVCLVAAFLVGLLWPFVLVRS